MILPNQLSVTLGSQDLALARYNTCAHVRNTRTSTAALQRPTQDKPNSCSLQSLLQSLARRRKKSRWSHTVGRLHSQRLQDGLGSKGHNEWTPLAIFCGARAWLASCTMLGCLRHLETLWHWKPLLSQYWWERGADWWRLSLQSNTVAELNEVRPSRSSRPPQPVTRNH